MKITSTNIAKPTTIVWNGKKTKTGIYKTPTNAPIYLEKETVKSDEVSDRNVHGGIYKACYLFSENQYDYWKKLYPHLDWNYGMFGENLTVKNLDETKLFIGDIYKIGEALVQVTQPREPCFKLGLRFGSQEVIQQFINYGFPGIYVRVLQEGFVQTGNSLKCMEHDKSSISIYDFFQLLYSKTKNLQHLKAVHNHKALPQKKRALLNRFIKNHIKQD
ncbi:MOSC domain-containing protein [Hwangdonia lutea]|uniref:MOSC domain-containing protein n=1 Tax=Hwangdonia lutea TaxID=3075823 RepID=A0AA97EJH0_9FLAO|nr:MOSC domain-containing protein [Hwangdonia sp. SCSIO 19198]WOD42579.1 MOSC domain-containing protein [Hwangdonia sp. SCSIO 19198]